MDFLLHLRDLCSDKADTNSTRQVHLGDPEANEASRFVSNAISTGKYNLVTFFPRGLFEQFRRVANLYFLFTCVLSFMPFSPYSYVTTLTPLTFVIGLSLVKEALEDWQRHKMDLKTNNSETEVWDGSAVRTKHWKDVQVGDILVVRKDQFFPADLLLLGSSLENDIAYVETKNLDGETNLKLKQAVHVPDVEFTVNSLHNVKGYMIDCEAPNEYLYTFKGIFGGHGKKVPISPENVLLRGSSLRNTDRMIGAVIYSGHDTKVMMNSSRTPSKQSTLEGNLNKVVFCLFVLLLSMATMGALGLLLWTRDSRPLYYLDPLEDNSEYNPDRLGYVWMFSCLSSLVLYSYLIPISMYVTVDVIKGVQGFVFINQDRHMYHAESNTPAMARNSNLIEDLGRVEIVLSDKTGTLTNNVMEFCKCSIAGVSYGSGTTEVERAAMLRKGITPPPGSAEVAPIEKGMNMRDARLLEGAWRREARPDIIEKFFQLLAVCHTVIPEGLPVREEISYQAESPDEAAFVTAAKVLGFFFHQRTIDTCHVYEPDEGGQGEVSRDYVILDILEFTSTRKRMSVIYRGPDGKVGLFCKGADTVIYERLKKEEGANPFAKATLKHLEEYGEAGLRTLCLAYGDIEEEEYQAWHEEYVEARTMLNDDTEQQEALLAALYERIERDLVLLGATGLEDKLQSGVSQCIRQLARPGIGLWMLTGDKVETAINIGFACALLENNTSQHVVAVREDLAPEDCVGLLSPPSPAAAKAAITLLYKVLPSSEPAAVQARSVLETLVNAATPGISGGHPAQAPAKVKAAVDDAAAEMGPDAAKWLDRALVALQLQAAYDDIAAHAAMSVRTHNALVIDGRALGMAMASSLLRHSFTTLALACQTVICCRVSPKQKGLVTSLVKHSGKVTLAIGDGANDCEMIMAAHIGVGISGQEGMQAVMSSDYAIAQFRFLERLLLVHGHWNYRRIASVVVYFFYKNLVFGLSIFWYNWLGGFNGQSIYDDYFAGAYNLLFTSLPVLILGLFDQSDPVAALLDPARPSLYFEGQRNLHFNFLSVSCTLMNAVYQSMVLVSMVLYAHYLVSSRSSGLVEGYLSEGVSLYTCVVVTVNLQLALSLKYWNLLTATAFALSVGGYFLFCTIYSALPISFSVQMRSLFGEQLAPQACYWLLIPVTFAVAALPDLCARSLASAFRHLYHGRTVKLPLGVAEGENGLAGSFVHRNPVASIPSLANGAEEAPPAPEGNPVWEASRTKVSKRYRGSVMPDTVDLESYFAKNHSNNLERHSLSVAIPSRQLANLDGPHRNTVTCSTPTMDRRANTVSEMELSTYSTIHSNPLISPTLANANGPPQPSTSAPEGLEKQSSKERVRSQSRIHPLLAAMDGLAAIRRKSSVRPADAKPTASPPGKQGRDSRASGSTSLMMSIHELGQRTKRMSQRKMSSEAKEKVSEAFERDSVLGPGEWEPLPEGDPQ